MDIKGEEQVFRYAAHKGVPFLLLTDGNLWDFYLSMAEGVPDERRFYRAELTREERITEYVDSFEKFLLKSRVVSEEARQEAERRLKSNRERGEARKAIPGVWRTLLETPDDMLRDLLAEEVARACGTRPRLEDVEAFLKERLYETASTTTPRRSSQSTTTSASKSKKSTFDSSKWVGKPQSTVIGFVFNGERFETKAAYRALAEVLKVFDRLDSGFMTRFAEQTMGKWPLVAKTPYELYSFPNREKHKEDLENGWWLQKGTRSTTKEIKEHIKIACEVAGVKFGSELKLIER